MFRKSLFVFLFIFSNGIYSQTLYENYFLEFWNDFDKNYAYFEKQHIDWSKVKEVYMPLMREAKDDSAFIHLLEQVTYELYNGHVSLNLNYPESNKIIPSGQDIYAEKKGNIYYVTDVRKGSGAERCGIVSGMEITAFNGQPVSTGIMSFLPKFTLQHNDAMYNFALNMLLAGTHQNKREITVKLNEIEKVLYPDTCNTKNQNTHLLDYKILEGNIGYIKINNSLGNNDLIKDFDNALDSLMNTKSIILDLTETPSGGNTTVARGIMGRFIKKTLPYQMHRIDEKQYSTVRNWTEFVVPRGTIYKKKLIVMVGHWTGSMGEGMAIGFDGMKRAKITGTKMAGLLGAVYNFKIGNTNIGYQLPVESLYHINGTPREDFLPQYLTENSEETYIKALELAK